MSYIKRTSTIGLLFELVLALGFLAGISIFYQQYLSSLNTKIDDQATTIQDQSSQIQELITNIGNLNDEINLRNQRESDLSDQYLSLQDDKEAILSKWVETDEELNTTLEDLDEAYEEIDDLEDDIVSLELDIATLNQTMQNIIDDIEDICDEASSLNISDCEDYE